MARWRVTERPFVAAEDDYLVYSFNRFQACRFGFDGSFVDPKTHAHGSLREDILATLQLIDPHAIALDAEEVCRLLRDDVKGRGNDAAWVRGVFERERMLPEGVRQSCLRFSR